MTRILLIDDEMSVRKALRAMLEPEGFEVAEAGNGAEGVQAFRIEPADVVISDLFMPQKDGLEAIIELRRAFPDVKIIAMSGGGFGKDLDMLPAAKKLGASWTLEKPIVQQELLEAIRKVLD